MTIPTFMHWIPFELLQKALNGVEIVGWEDEYVVEAIVKAIESFLLDERIQFGAARGELIEPRGLPFMTAIQERLDLDRGVVSLTSDDEELGDIEDDMLAFAKAYNGRFGEVSVRMSPSEKVAFDSRFGEGALNNLNLQESALDEAYRKLSETFRVATTEVLPNRTRIILPPLVTALLSRLPTHSVDQDAFFSAMIQLREELSPIREKFNDYQRALDDPSISMREARKLRTAIGADAEHFRKKWDATVTDSAVIQFCLDKVSFLYKFLWKRDGLETEDFIEALAGAIPKLEKRFSVARPTLLSELAIRQTGVRDISQLLERHFDIRTRTMTMDDLASLRARTPDSA